MVTMTGSSGLRWAALAALAALAAADFLAQYVVAAASLASVLHLPPATVDFLSVSSTFLSDKFIYYGVVKLLHATLCPTCVPHTILSSLCGSFDCIAPLCVRTALPLQDVVGIECKAHGWSLALKLLASGSLLAALRLYRFGFAIGVLRVSCLGLRSFS